MSEYQLDDDLLRAVRAARPDVPPGDVSPNGASAAAVLDRVLAVEQEARADRSPGRSRKPRLGAFLPVIAVIVTAAVAVIFLGLHGTGSGTSSGGSIGRGVELIYTAQPTVGVPVVTRHVLERTAGLMRIRIRMLGVSSGGSVRVDGATIVVRLPPGAVKLPPDAEQKRALQAIGTTTQLLFYDWEANAIDPTTGDRVGNELAEQKPSALIISQGRNTAAPGSTGAGSLPLYQAVQLASKQPESTSDRNARIGTEHYLFGAPGSRACTTAAADAGIAPAPGVHCLLAGPVSLPAADSPGAVKEHLTQMLPAEVSGSGGEQLSVKPGTVVLEATPTSFSNWPDFGSPSTGYYVLHDNVALSSSEITNPKASTDSAGQPDVAFGFTPEGAGEFQRLTAEIAQRGTLNSLGGSQLDQHFAIALDNRLVTVPSIASKVYPDGITGSGGAVIAGSFTTNTARQLAEQLRFGALPINLRLVTTKYVPVSSAG